MGFDGNVKSCEECQAMIELKREAPFPLGDEPLACERHRICKWCGSRYCQEKDQCDFDPYEMYPY